MYHRITLTELHQCTKFGGNKSKFPKPGGSLANELCRACHAQPASYRNGNHKSMFAGEAYMLPARLASACLACKGGKITTGAKHLHVHCTCTMHPSLFLHTATSRPCQGGPTYQVWCRQLKVSLNRRTPRQKSFPPLARAACTPQERHPQWISSWNSMHVTCEIGISGASRLFCRCVRIFKCANHLHVHCTCTMHPSPFLHTAPSRPSQGAPMYRVWCR